MDLLDLPDWIIWGLIAIGLVVVEMLTTVYVALGFAVGAAVVSLITWAYPGVHVFIQGLIAAAVGLVVWLGLSRWHAARRKTRPDINDFDSLASLPRVDRERREALHERDDSAAGR